MPFFDLHSKTFQQKLSLIIILTTSLGMILACTVFSIYEIVRFKQNTVNRLSMMAQIIGDRTTAAIVFNDQISAQESLVALGVDKHIVSAYIFDNTNQLFASYVRNENETKTFPVMRDNGHYFEGNNLILYSSIDLEGTRIGTIYINSDLHEIFQTVLRDIGIILVIILLIIVLTLLLSKKAQHLLTKPITQLAETIKVVSDTKDYSVRAEKFSDDELGIFVVSFNEMLMHIQERDGELLETHKALKIRAHDLEETLNELKKTQEKIVKTEKMASIGKLSAKVAHELRNPLGSLSNAIYYIRDSVSSTTLLKDDPTVEEMFKIMLIEIESANKITSDLLDWARVVKLSISFNNINHLISNTLKSIKIPTDIEIVENFSSDMPKIKCDPQRMRQVFINLTNNALQSMKSGGKLTIVTKVKDDSQFQIQFIDTGKGMDKHTLERLFEPMITTKEGGTGLGLTISKEFIEAHNGKIVVESELNKGSKFIIELPFEKSS